MNAHKFRECAAHHCIYMASLVVLPVDLQEHIASYLEKHCALLLTGCHRDLSALLQRARLWREIRFTRPAAARLTDDALASLLTRVNARENCAFLSLRGCTGLRGRGLIPLTGSATLQFLDFRLPLDAKGQLGRAVDANVVCQVLSSLGDSFASLLLPEKHGSATSVSGSGGGMKEPWASQVAHIEEAMGRRAVREGARCTECDRSAAHLLEKRLEGQPRRSTRSGARTAEAYQYLANMACPCSACGKRYCAHMREPEAGAEHSTWSCDEMNECSVCGHYFCNECEDNWMNDCEHCGERICSRCPGGAMQYCRMCDRMCCHGCEKYLTCKEGCCGGEKAMGYCMQCVEELDVRQCRICREVCDRCSCMLECIECTDHPVCADCLADADGEECPGCGGLCEPGALAELPEPGWGLDGPTHGFWAGANGGGESDGDD